MYGIRELTQNAADSIREMGHLLTAGIGVSEERLTREADIELQISMHPVPSLVISDRGTGMTLDVLQNFFLRAGASFRNSELWKAQFADASGASKIARAGRFGVGALSAFLIGERISVYTRHFSDQSGKGLAFVATIDGNEIEIVEEKGPIGTRISIESDQGRIERIATYFRRSKQTPDFFVSADVTLNVSVDVPPRKDSTKRSDENEEEVRAAVDALAQKPRWIPVTGTMYTEVQWDRTTHRWRRYSGWAENQCGYVFCNGILVGDLLEPQSSLIVKESSSRVGGVWEIVAPTISVKDNSGLMPLDLARKGFVRTDAELEDRVLGSMWAELLATFFYSQKFSGADICELWTSGDYLFKSSWIPIVFGKDGFTFLDEDLLDTLSPERLVVLPYSQGVVDRVLSDPFLDDGTFVLFKKTFWSQSRSDIVTTVSRSAYASVLPSFRHRLGSDETFASTYFVFDKGKFEQALIKECAEILAGGAR